MSRFVQLHLLTSYPPSNLNRDDLGQPKSALFGGVSRLRISSQSLKRAWRISEIFTQELAGHVGTRTKLLGVEAEKKLKALGVKDKQATDWAASIAAVYGAVKKEKGKELEIEQLVHISPAEQKTLDQLLAKLASESRSPKQDELDALLHDQAAVDIAMFGRMLASKPEFNGEAAVQVAHALGVHASPIEDDYFTAVDDLNVKDPGASHIGENAFGSAVFYQYICIDREQLKENLGGDEELTAKAIRALIQAAIKVAPGGKQNSFASRAYAHFAMAEKGNQQPRSLALAFLKPVTARIESDFGSDATEALIATQKKMDQVYGSCADDRRQFDVQQGTGSVAELLDFASQEG
jgi:CRISPR system Cascade subunit CasC